MYHSQEHDYFTCDNSIIYGMSGGAKARIIECLEGRTSKYVKPSELAGVTSIGTQSISEVRCPREIDLTESADYGSAGICLCRHYGNAYD